jgi:CTP synthase (UTP-ammonia lyase)
VDYCHQHYPDLLVIAIPNDAKRSPRDGYIHKRMGTVAGVPDVFILDLLLWIEFKTATGQLSKNQQKTIARIQNIRRVAYEVVVCRSTQEAINLIKQKIADLQLADNQADKKNL